MIYGWKQPLRFHQCDTISSIVVVLDQVNTAVEQDLWVLGNLESMEETVVLSHISIISTSALTAVLLFETDSSREGFRCFSCRFIQCCHSGLWPNSHISFHHFVSKDIKKIVMGKTKGNFFLFIFLWMFTIIWSNHIFSFRNFVIFYSFFYSFSHLALQLILFQLILFQHF